MLGIRSDEEKSISKTALYSSQKIDEITPKKTKIDAFARIYLNCPSELTLTCGEIEVTAYGQVPEKAITSPLSHENIKKNLTKLGATDFELEQFTLSCDEEIILPISALNELRRNACQMLQEALEHKKDVRLGFEKYVSNVPKSARKEMRSARFYNPDQITDSAREYFDTIYLPLQNYNGECEGIILPPVILDSELKEVETMLQNAKEKGAKYALVGNLGALNLVKKFGFIPQGDFRFNVYNNETVAKLEDLGVESVMLSPELTLPQMRDVLGDTASIVYGRLPLMLLEKCVSKEVTTCEKCEKGRASITDRRGVSFPILREFEHRNVIYNSAPTYMADLEADLKRANITNRHFIFSIESPNEVDNVITAHKKLSPAKENQKIRRI
jgi:putative protease